MIQDPWATLKRFTGARIALGRAGDSLTTEALLEFGLAHARARDAVHEAFDVESIGQQLTVGEFNWITVHSAAANRDEYLRRPDLGRRLDPESRGKLCEGASDSPADVVFVVADGLSAKAAKLHAVPFLEAMCEGLQGWRVGPVVIAEQARVAIGDEIGEILNASAVVMLVGERPGLSSPDSLGIYLTYCPHVGRTDAERNCISNVRPEGLSYDMAAHRLQHLLTGARRLGISGIALKDESDWEPKGLHAPEL